MGWRRQISDSWLGYCRPVKVLIVTQYFPPELGAAQQRLGHYSQGLASAGHQVTVLTTMPSYPWGRTLAPYNKKLLVRERAGAVDIVRTATTALGPEPGLAKRAGTYGFFVLTALPVLMWLARRADVALVESPPLTTALLALAIRALGTPYLLSVSDLWPQSAVEIGAIRDSRLIGAGERLELLAYRRASRVIALTEGIRAHVAGLVAPERVVSIPNGVDRATFSTFRPPPASDGRYSVMYAGTVGLAQGLDIVLPAAEELEPEGVHFTVVGDGAARADLARRRDALGLRNVHLLPSRPRAEVLEMIRDVNVLLVSLRDTPALRGAVPSKLYEAMASARPVLLVAQGEAARLVEDTGCGEVVPPGDAAGLVAAVRRLRSSGRAGEMGDRGQQFVFAHRDLDAHVRRLEGLLQKAVEDDGRRDRTG